MNNGTISTDVLVVGAGIAGMTAAIEAAESGFSVVLVDKQAYAGGRVVQLNKYFPKLCPPTCGLEINLKRLKDNQNIKLITLASVESLEGTPGDYRIKIRQMPRFVTDRCTSCGDCAETCPVETDNKFNLGLDKSKAIYLPYNNAYPQRYMIDMAACKGEACSACVSACAYDAIKLNQKEHSFELKAKSVIWATGWEPYNAKRLENLGYGRYKGVVTNLEMERLAAANGPGSGKINIPGLDREIKSVVFVQCAGSRDETHLEYCSSVCCLASMKQAGYLREQFPEAEIYIYYIDVRTPGFFEDFYTDTQRDGHIHFVRGKVAKVFEDKGRLVVEAEDTIEGGLRQTAADLVVLATGMQPSILKNDVPGRKHLDENGFFLTRNGVIACGVATGPKDVASAVQEATGAAMKAIHILKGGN